MIEMHDHLADELGECYRQTRRTFHLPHESEIRSACELLSDEPSRYPYLATVRFRVTGDFSVLHSPDRDYQYVPRDIPAWNTPLRLVDCGAYDGDTLNGVLRAGTSIPCVGALEPDADCVSRLCRPVEERGYDRKEVYLWPRVAGPAICHVRFDRGRGEASEMAATGDAAVPSVASDDIQYGISADPIGVGVEGAEREVILGTHNIIANAAPGLALCVYHPAKDLLETPLLIEGLDSCRSPQAEYRYCLRLHAHSGLGLVLDAVPVAPRIS